MCVDFFLIKLARTRLIIPKYFKWRKEPLEQSCDKCEYYAKIVLCPGQNLFISLVFNYFQVCVTLNKLVINSVMNVVETSKFSSQRLASEMSIKTTVHKTSSGNLAVDETSPDNSYVVIRNKGEKVTSVFRSFPTITYFLLLIETSRIKYFYLYIFGDYADCGRRNMLLFARYTFTVKTSTLCLWACLSENLQRGSQQSWTWAHSNHIDERFQGHWTTIARKPMEVPSHMPLPQKWAKWRRLVPL